MNSIKRGYDMQYQLITEDVAQQVNHGLFASIAAATEYLSRWVEAEGLDYGDQPITISIHPIAEEGGRCES